MTGDYISTRRTDGMEASVLHAGLLHVPPQPAWKMEGSRYELDSQGRPITGINTLLVRMGDSVVLVDPNSWLSGGIVRSKYAETFLVPGPTIEESLAVLGVQPAEVTHVLITHGHWDHYSAVITEDGKPRFTNAQHFFPAADWRAFAVEDQRGDAALLRAHFDPLADTGLLRMVEGDVDVAPGIRLLFAPGESPGHQIAHFQSAEGSVYYLGDQFHYPAEFIRIDAAGPGRDVAEMLRGRLRVLGMIEQETATPMLVFTHGVFPAWGKAERGATWKWSYT
jgi:glyoxylase-like metal-dependent hydrolase (beta-lactamase superfamily II)